jgi:hypothetical protein
MCHPTRNAQKVARSEKIRFRPQTPQPTVNGSRRGGSDGLEPHISGVFQIEALDPVLDTLQRERTLLVEGGVDLSRTRGARFESIQLELVAVVDGTAQCLLSAPQVGDGAGHRSLLGPR